jgi:hypothetical protein
MHISFEEFLNRARISRRVRGVVLTGIAVLIATVVAWASIPDANGVIHGCADKLTGVTRIIDSSAQCLPTEHVINWNQAGAPGPAGSGDGCVSVKDLGAKGDGSVNDGLAIQAALETNVCVTVPPGTYRVDDALIVTNQLVVSFGAHLIRMSAHSGSTDPVVVLASPYATLIGGGWVESENNSPHGVVLVGPRTPTTITNIIWTRIDGIKIKGTSADENNTGLALETTEKGGDQNPGGTNYNGSFSNLVIQFVSVGVKVNPIVNGHTFSNIFFYSIKRYSYWAVGNSENTFYGGFTHLSHGVTVMKLEGCFYDLFYGVQAEPGPGSRYFDIDAASKYCQILGHNNCDLSPINDSTNLIYMYAGHLSLNNLQAVDQQNTLFPNPPYKPVPIQGDPQPDSSAASVDQLKTDFNALLTKLRASGALKQ